MKSSLPSASIDTLLILELCSTLYSPYVIGKCLKRTIKRNNEQYFDAWWYFYPFHCIAEELNHGGLELAQNSRNRAHPTDVSDGKEAKGCSIVPILAVLYRVGVNTSIVLECVRFPEFCANSCLH